MDISLSIKVAIMVVFANSSVHYHSDLFVMFTYYLKIDFLCQIGTLEESLSEVYELMHG